MLVDHIHYGAGCLAQELELATSILLSSWPYLVAEWWCDYDIKYDLSPLPSEMFATRNCRNGMGGRQWLNTDVIKSYVSIINVHFLHSFQKMQSLLQICYLKASLCFVFMLKNLSKVLKVISRFSLFWKRGHLFLSASSRHLQLLLKDTHRD